jgi:hypothetical protein
VPQILHEQNSASYLSDDAKSVGFLWMNNKLLRSGESVTVLELRVVLKEEYNTGTPVKAGLELHKLRYFLCAYTLLIVTSVRSEHQSEEVHDQKLPYHTTSSEGDKTILVFKLQGHMPLSINIQPSQSK